MNLFAVFAFVTFAAAPVPKEPPKAPVESIEGEWKLVEFVKEGRPREKEAITTMTFKAGKLTIADGKRDETATYTLDPKATPFAIDLVPEKGGGRKETVKGIYKIEKDKLIICFSMDGADRPKEFKSEPGTKTGMFTLERVRK